MSTQKKQTELTVFGYIRDQYTLSIPIVIIKVIELFYDIFFYWNIKGKEMEEFLSAEQGQDLLCNKLFKIKDIEFGCKVYPNGRSWKDTGMVASYLRLKYLPSNIEYIGIYYQFKCEETQCIHNRFKIFSKKMSSGIYMTNVSKCKHLEQINFIVYIDIRYIKYKSDVNKIDYIKPLKMHSNVNYIWNIKGDLMNKCKALQKTEYIVSENFDGDNWNLRLYQDEKIALDLNCLWVPFGIKSFEMKLKMIINGDINYEIKAETYNFEEPHYNASCQDLTFDKVENLKEISVTVEMEILKLLDLNDKIVKECDWAKYGVIKNQM